jgi:hypothetical protein
MEEQVTQAVKEAAMEYSKSEATTGAGRWLRFLVRFVPVETIIKALAHKISK